MREKLFPNFIQLTAIRLLTAFELSLKSWCLQLYLQTEALPSPN